MGSQWKIRIAIAICSAAFSSAQAQGEFSGFLEDYPRMQSMKGDDKTLAWRNENVDRDTPA